MFDQSFRSPTVKGIYFWKPCLLFLGKISDGQYWIPFTLSYKHYKGSLMRKPNVKFFIIKLVDFNGCVEHRNVHIVSII